MNKVSGLGQSPAFQGSYLLRLPGKKGETFLTTIKTDKFIDDIVEIKGEGIYKGKKTGENFRYENKKGFDDTEFINIMLEIQSKIKDRINVLESVLDATWAEGRKKLGEMVQVLEP